MKKVLCIIVALLMVFGLAACGSSTNTVTESASEAPTEAATEEPSEAATEAPAEVEFPEMTLTLSSPVAENTITAGGLEEFKKYVEETTGGKVTVECYFNSSLIPQDQEVNTLMANNVDIVTGGLDRISEYMPILEVFNMPYLYQSLEHSQEYWATDKAHALLDQVAQDIGVRVFPDFGYFGERTVNLNVDKKVTCRADLTNFKVRFPNVEAWIFIGECLGANSVGTAWSEVYLALQTGTLDGQDNPVATTKSSSLYEVTESVTLTGHTLANLYIMMNEEKYQSMSPELQQVIKEAVVKFGDYLTETTITQEADDIAFLEKNGMTIYELTPEEKAAYSQEVKDYFFANTKADIDMDIYNDIQDALS